MGKQEWLPGPTSGICFELLRMDEFFHRENKSQYNKSQKMLMRRYDGGRGGNRGINRTKKKSDPPEGNTQGKMLYCLKIKSAPGKEVAEFKATILEIKTMLKLLLNIIQKGR